MRYSRGRHRVAKTLLVTTPQLAAPLPACRCWLITFRGCRRRVCRSKHWQTCRWLASRTPPGIRTGCCSRLRVIHMRRMSDHQRCSRSPARLDARVRYSRSRTWLRSGAWRLSLARRRPSSSSPTFISPFALADRRCSGKCSPAVDHGRNWFAACDASRSGAAAHVSPEDEDLSEAVSQGTQTPGGDGYADAGGDRRRRIRQEIGVGGCQVIAP